ncbi:ankyrin repeat domain-containing protein [Shewanella xiamenensis]|uniref:ankyrin repeat domain-containing protein n=1 Tax=Shewanella xiamenensis TaxID=332186 RepID=UPI0035B755BF
MNTLIKLLQRNGHDVPEDTGHSTLALAEAYLGRQLISREYKTITEAESYLDLLVDVAARTLGDWVPENLSVAGDFESSLRISFDYQGDTYTWPVAQQGSHYISSDLVEALQQFSLNKLPGVFVDIPDIDLWHCCYLPNATAEDLRDWQTELADIERLVNHYRNGGDMEMEHFECQDRIDERDSQGDTALTAAVKAGNASAATELMDNLGANPEIWDANGQTPVMLALNSGDSEMIEQFDWTWRPPSPIDELWVINDCFGGDDEETLQRSHMAREVFAHLPTAVLQGLEFSDHKVNKGCYFGRAGALRYGLALIALEFSPAGISLSAHIPERMERVLDLSVTPQQAAEFIVSRLS